ncbi:YfhO family protein [Bacillus xiapuensis]|uniref:YfhO family protein n=1 Tax=Bacillus xiapuensis TaxID=2014075 RepID=UPI000C2482D3|nr:YfhO family protein [Bacillus xiapuensis]
MNRKTVILLIISSLLVSAAAHFFFIQEWLNNRFMLGPNDGLSQMAPFKKFIYENYREGSFFYSWSFGLGGGFYSQLAYYFSTSILFYLTAASVFVLEFLHLVDTSDVQFWAETSLFVSILRLTLILAAAASAFRYMKLNAAAAFSGAVVYACSLMYFRHVVFWEFFADAMLWVPLLVLGTEKVIREGKPGWLIFTASIMLFSNFYFAYINVIFLIIYVIFRWLLPLSDEERGKAEQLKLFITSGLISFCISAVGFIPAVYGFLNNYRPDYEAEIAAIDWSDNIFFTSRYILLPVVFVLFVLIISFYKHRVFRLFAYISFLFIAFHFSPLAASAFNGFSAPQYRFEYLLSFTAGGCVAAGLHYIKEVRFPYVLAGIILAACIYYIQIPPLDLMNGKPEQIRWVFLLLAVTAAFLLLLSWRQKTFVMIGLQCIIVVSSIAMVNAYAKYTLSEQSGVHKVSRDYMESDAYNSEEQQNLIKRVKERNDAPFARIDWMTKTRNNTPIVQNFDGTSLYSSIINQELLLFYWRDLLIDMGRESVSRYATLGNRAHLHSLLQANYWMRPKDQAEQAPFGFRKLFESADYAVFENTLPLPFVRTVDKVFNEKDLTHATPLDKEHAMLQGIILENAPSADKLDKKRNIIDQANIQMSGAVYDNQRLSVTNKRGGLDIIPNQLAKDTKDLFLGFSITRLDGKGFSITVNGYETTRKAADSIYKTNINELFLRIPADQKVALRLPKGSYRLEDLSLYEESYHELRTAAAQPAAAASVNWKHNKLTIDYANKENDSYMVLPIPFEKGWELRVNGNKQPLKRANYAFTGLELAEGRNQIELVYLPPFFKPSAAISLLGLLWSMLFIRRTRKNESRLKNV